MPELDSDKELAEMRNEKYGYSGFADEQIQGHIVFHRCRRKYALQHGAIMLKYHGMNFSRYAEAGHSDPFLVSGGF